MFVAILNKKFLQ